MNWEGLESGLGMIEVLSRLVPGSTEEDNKKRQSFEPRISRVRDKRYRCVNLLSDV
jgi:hypothetical protein